MKKYLFLIFIVPTFLLLFLSQQALAQTTPPTTNPTSTTSGTNNNTTPGAGGINRPNQAANQQNRITNLKSRADAEIDRRITSLNKLLTRISGMKRLSSAQISAFTSEIQTEITNLTNLKAKIDADTDLATLQTDVKSIVLSYRVYALFMPQLHILAAADRILEYTDKFTAFATKLQSRITQAQSQGKDVSSLQAALTDMEAKIADAKTQANNAIAEVTPLTPDGYPGNKSTLLDARSKIKAALTDLQGARQDAMTIINGLKGLKGTGVSPAVSQTASPTATTTTQP